MADLDSKSGSLADHDGFVEAIYHQLWAKNSHGEPCQVLVPDVIIYKYRIPAYWYFTGADGRLKRKNKANIVNQRILAHFSAHARSERDVVACHICEQALDPNADAEEGRTTRTETVIRYFDRAGLKEFLFNEEKVNDGCLQKFVRPKGLFNSMIQAAWSPQLCLLERRVNLTPLLSGRAPLQERTATYEGSEHLSRITPVRGTLLADQIQLLCAEMVDHIAATSHTHQRVTRMLANFKTDMHDNIWFLWCSSIRVVEDAEPSSLADPPAASEPAVAGGTPSARGTSSSQRTLVSSSSTADASSLAAVCLNPAVRSPTRPPRPKKDARPSHSVCPFTGKELDDAHPYLVTYQTILDYAHVLDVRARTRREYDEVPPLLQRVCPDLDGETFAKERSNPLSPFLHTRVLCSEEAYLDFTSAALPGVQVGIGMCMHTGACHMHMHMPGAQVLPALPKKTRQMFASASTSTLPPIAGAVL